MVKGKGPTSFFYLHIDIQFLQHRLLKRCPFPLNGLNTLLEGLGFSILYHQFMSVSQDYIYCFRYVALQEVLESGCVSPPTLLFLKTVLPTQGPLEGSYES